MVDESRIGIYNYLYDLFYDVVTRNVYAMQEPQELTSSDVKDGFLVIQVGNINDESEFACETYGWARCYVYAFVPPISRGRLDYDKFETFENAINSVIKTESENSGGTYGIQYDSVVSNDIVERSNANNTYFTFAKSFIVNIEKES
jgi:hypothetical protein